MKKKKINDFDMKKWKEYEDIITDSLWIIKKRDNSGEHKGDYHGNFIPQIPYQLINRYTKKGEWVLDAFLGSGTTLIECKKLERNGIGIDIDPEILKIAKERVKKEKGISTFEFVNGDSSKIELDKYLNKNDIRHVNLIIYHPPYWDIIKFNNHKGNLANMKTLENFLEGFEKVLDNTAKYLEEERYIGVIIGDIYKDGEWIPLGSHIIQLMISKKYVLKSVVVKNINETKGKQNQKAIWRYRSLVGGFYVFSHEYILIFKKPKERKKNNDK